MGTRCLSAITVLVLTLIFLPVPADAGWWFGEDSRQGKVGLDVTGGYDVNTVATMTGTVVALPRAADKGPVLIEVRSGGELVFLSVGPKGFWDAKGIPVRLDDELVAKGSRAQGADGRLYLMVQRLTNTTAGTRLDLRSDAGEPVWSGRGAGAGSSAGGFRYQGGGMMRSGSGGMMRGSGGGGMRR